MRVSKEEFLNELDRRCAIDGEDLFYVLREMLDNYVLVDRGKLEERKQHYKEASSEIGIRGVNAFGKLTLIEELLDE